ncbi:MAG: LPXTG-motif cell wall anchor domain protein, partial [Candidatus Gottesmanbacteria bacterium GW2011_GWA1_48_13]
MTIQQAARFLRVSSKTLRRWEAQGILIPATRTSGNQRRYTQEQLANFSHPAPTTPPHTPSPLFSIDHAANFLHVNPKTLRRWEALGALVPFRTVGNQRRYTQEQLETFTRPLQLPKIFHFSKVQKFLITTSSVATLISLAIIIFRITPFYPPLNLRGGNPKGEGDTSKVLASQTVLDDLSLMVNVPAKFNQPVEFTGGLKSPDLLYGVTAGTGVTITGDDQNPTISVTDQTTNVKTFKTVKVGTTTFDAGSNTDTLTLAAGDNASLSINTSDKKITFSTTVPSTGFTDDGSLIRLSTATDLLSVGSSTGAAKLSIEGGSYAGDLLTASQSGNLLLKLSNTGNLTLSGSLVVSGDITAGGAAGYWQRAAGAISPANITDDLLIGATSTASAKIALNASTGQLITTLFKLTTGGSAGYFLTSDASGVGSWTDISTSGTAGPWTLSGSTLFPDSNSNNLLVGSALVADDIGKLTVSGSKSGKALVVLNVTNSDQNILVASSSGVNKLILSNTGNLTLSGDATLSGTLSLAPKLQVDAGTCNAASAGKQYYDAANTKYYYCNGTNWFPVGETSGQISAFATACPSGWTEYTAARGRTVVGTPASGTIAGTVGTALTDLEDRTHSHSVDPPSTGTSGSGSSPGSSGGGFPDTTFAPSHSHTVDIASLSSGTTATSNVIAYIQLTYCQKDTGSDLAEWIGSNVDISAATIVSTDPQAAEKVIPSTVPYDPHVVGIVATKPGWLIGDQNTGGIQMALVGRVPTRVSLTNGDIKIGDAITTSDIPGVGMKATKPGWIIGKAMQDLTGDVGTLGTITVFLDPVWQDGVGEENLQVKIASISAELAQLRFTPETSNWQYSTESGKLVTTFPIQVPEITVTGQLQVGLLTFDDLASSISSLTGKITIKGDLAVTGSLKVLGSSAGTAVFPSGTTELLVSSDLVSSASAVFATAEEAVPIGTQTTQPGEFILKIPSALPADLKVKWWIVN